MARTISPVRDIAKDDLADEVHLLTVVSHGTAGLTGHETAVRR